MGGGAVEKRTRNIKKTRKIKNAQEIKKQTLEVKPLGNNKNAAETNKNSSLESAHIVDGVYLRMLGGPLSRIRPSRDMENYSGLIVYSPCLELGIRNHFG